MRSVRVTAGVYYLEIPEAGMNILCGCPADSVKHLMRKGLIVPLESEGAKFESGPNAILLSDVAVQNERFCNLGEFPVLQMLYRQGMIIPNHPNNTGRKPMIIGNAPQVKAQAEYIYRGNYGLVSEAELKDAGLSAEEARAIIRMKLKFAYDSIKKTSELLDLRVIGQEATALRDGVTVKRLRPNVFEIRYAPEDAAAAHATARGAEARGGAAGGAQASRSVTIDLNLAPGEEYQPPYELGYHDMKREYFSVVHSGEGDGWDPDHPCMASVITFQGRIYLMDAGPNILASLTALGLSANDVEGIFQSHAHDDHVAGLPCLMRTDHRIKYYASRLVRKSVAKKLSALLSIRESYFERCFEVQDLPLNEWTDIDGLEVRPALSVHPVETNIFFLRTLWTEGYRTYSHLADTASIENMKKMVSDDPKKSGITSKMFENVRREYLTSVDVKKVDVGGGMIHGRAGDFAADKTRKILLSHTGSPLSDREKEIGGSAAFGMAEVLVPADQDFMKAHSFAALETYFPDVPAHELRMLLNCPVVSFNPGERIFRGGDPHEEIFFVLSGLLEFIDSEHGVRVMLSSGAMAGEVSGTLGTPSPGTYRTISRVYALNLPATLYREFLARNGRFDEIRKHAALRRFLQITWLFGNMVSAPVINRIMKELTIEKWNAGEQMIPVGRPELYLVREGEIRILAGNHVVTEAGPGNFFGSEIIIFGRERHLHGRTSAPSTICRIPATAMNDIPVVQWKLLETYERRMRAADGVAAKAAPASGGLAKAAERSRSGRNAGTSRPVPPAGKSAPKARPQPRK